MVLNTQQYELRINNKVEQSWEKSSVLPYTFGVVAIEKAAFWLPSTAVAKFTTLIMYRIVRFYSSFREETDSVGSFR